MVDAGWIEAVEQIKILKARYFYHVDLKQWDRLGEVFSEDAVLDVASGRDDVADPSKLIFTGRERIVKVLAGALKQTVATVHHGHTPIIEISGPDTATGIWAMEDILFFADGRHTLGYGHYHETYVRASGRWQIARLSLTRLRTVEDPFVSRQAQPDAG